jgi:hypothetical protein
MRIVAAGSSVKGDWGPHPRGPFVKFAGRDLLGLLFLLVAFIMALGMKTTKHTLDKGRLQVIQGILY